MKRKSPSHQVAKTSRLLAILLMILFGLQLTANSQQPTANSQHPLWMRYNVISPQGDKIAFTYKGDIYVVDAGVCIDCCACEAVCPTDSIVEA